MNVAYCRPWLDVMCEFVCMYLEVCFSMQKKLKEELENWNG